MNPEASKIIKLSIFFHKETVSESSMLNYYQDFVPLLYVSLLFRLLFKTIHEVDLLKKVG